MPEPEQRPEGGEESLEVPFDRVAKFVRQLSHDVRNNLGSLDLQAAYLAELIADPETAAELKKLRGMIGSTAKMLQGVSANFRVPRLNRITIPARMFIEDFRERLAKTWPEEAAQIEWQGDAGDASIGVDVELMFAALSELVRNALHFHETKPPIHADASVSGDALVIEIREQRATVASPPATWGMSPLTSTRRGGYGLGLFHARQILAAHTATLDFVHEADKATLTTRVLLPLGAAPEDV